jgi:hypothetical protein
MTPLELRATDSASATEKELRQQLLNKLAHLSPVENAKGVDDQTTAVWDASWDATWDASWNANAP